MTKQDVLVLDDIMRSEDALGCAIADQQLLWEHSRQEKVNEWKETQRYAFATDTSKTSNSKLPWSNKTTRPKLTQIRDNLIANYMSTLFPKRKWLIWEGAGEDDETIQKQRSIESYMLWTMDRNNFRSEALKLISDYVDFGNCFATVDWVDEEHIIENGPLGAAIKGGFRGPQIRRISPYDIVFNPIASSFERSSKIIRSLVSVGDIADLINSNPNPNDPEQAQDNEALLAYFLEFRGSSSDGSSFSEPKDDAFQVQGFDSFQAYLSSDTAEVLTFYGDIYDPDSQEFLRNKIITVVDRHKVISVRDNPTLFSNAPIFHAGWRIRPDSLWAMGPLDNLVGMQYRIDHLENLKADVFDLTAFPVFKITGTDVEDFNWGPMERIYVGKDDVEIVSPNVQALNADSEIEQLKQEMEESAGSPREAAGFRTPGEKTKFEFQQLSNAASRIFQHKILQLEQELFEPVLNAKLELARRTMAKPTTIRTFDEELSVAVFETLTVEDITGMGRIRPVAARHFSEQSQKVQDLSTLFNSGAGGDPEVKQHFSSLKLAKLYAKLLGLEEDNLVEPFVRVSERADAARLENSAQEQVQMETLQPSGLFEGDVDEDLIPPETLSEEQEPEGSLDQALSL